MPPCLAYRATGHVGYSQEEALQAAEILGIQEPVKQLLAAQNLSASNSDENLFKRSLVLRRILRGVLEVRQACNKIDFELAYTYDVVQKEERRESCINALFNLAVFAQLSAFYTMEPYFRLQKDFATSAIFTTTSGSLGTTITTLSKLHGKVAKASHVAPPRILEGMVDGGPVDTTGLPPLLTKYLDAKAPNSTISRREELFQMWKNSYHIDASNVENLCSITNKNKASIYYLNSRILLLWSLHTFVQDFDRDLLALLKLLKRSDAQNGNASGDKVITSGYTDGANEVAQLLKIQSQVDELERLRKSKVESARRDELEILVLESTLEGALELQVASDKVDEELNYNHHVILAQLLETRARWLQYNYNLNFLQSGILGIIAGRLYLSRISFAGDQMFVVAGSNGTCLTALAMLETHGGWRKVDTGPNSLAEVLNLHPPTEYRFSPFVSSFLNDHPPGSTDGKSRREILNDAWKKNKVTTVNLNRPKTLNALASMETHKYDTIKQVTNRLILLHSLKKELESFQFETLDLLRATE